MTRYICNGILLLFLFSCTEGDKKTIETKLYPNGKTESVVTKINDTILDGISLYYYSDGSLKEQTEYGFGKKNGIHCKYYKNGQREFRVNYKDGSRHGTSYWYYENGQIKEKSNWLNGKEFGDAFFYYENGKLENYSSYDFERHNRYLIKFDSNGVKLKEEGSILGQFLLDGDFDSIPVNKEITAKISVVNPPERLIKVYLKCMQNAEFKNIKTTRNSGKIKCRDL